MTTLLIARSKDGKRTRTCNARCYNAKGKRCTCICGGKNHGVGYDQALDNTFLEPAWDSVDHVSWNINPVHVQLMVF